MYYWSLPVRRTLLSVHLDARPNHARNVFISCNKLHATGALFHIVACILMHDRTTHGTLFTTFRVFTISCNELHATGSVIPYCSVHLDARMISPRCGMKCGGFWVCFSCNKLHATGENDLTSVRDSRFRATSCTLRGAVIISVCGDYWHFCVGRCMLKQN